MIDKKSARVRRSIRGRKKIAELKAYRLCVHRTPRHIYAQVISPVGGRVIAAVSTVEQSVRQEVSVTGNIKAATVVGRLIAERAKAAGVTKIAFDRSGFKYHGRVKALADAARESGLEF